MQRSHRLFAKDKEHPSASCKVVRLLAADFMATVNKVTLNKPEQTDTTIAAFWEHTSGPSSLTTTSSRQRARVTGRCGISA